MAFDNLFKNLKGLIGHKFVAGRAGQIPVVIQGAASQSANLLEIRDSSGSAVFSVGSDGDVTADGLAVEAGTIGTAELADDAVTTAKIDDSQITNALMADNAIDSAEIVAGAIDTAHIADDQVTMAKLEEQILKYVDVTVPTAEVLTLNATPKSIVPTPGAGQAVVPIGAMLFLDFATTAYDTIAAGEDLVFRYTDGSGTAALTVEATGFMDASADATRWAPASASLLTPTADAAMVLHMSAGEISTGDSDLKIRFYYRVIPTTL